MEMYQEKKEEKIKQLEVVLNKDLTFKPVTHSTHQTASKYYERQMKKIQAESEARVYTEASSRYTSKMDSGEHLSQASSMKGSHHSIVNPLPPPQPAKLPQHVINTIPSMTPTFNMSVNDSVVRPAPVDGDFSS